MCFGPLPAVCILAFLVHAEPTAQTPDPDVEPIVMTRNLVIHAGLSRFVGDLGESEYGGFGPAVRAGLVLPDETRARGYAWDTRALLASIRAGWKASTYPGLGIRLGPLIAAMGEGPDNGANFGGTAEVSFGARLGEFPLEAAIGWLWIARSDSRYPGDQHGLTLSLGLGS